MVEFSCLKETLFATEFTKSYAGDALNTAVAARRLGSSVGLITGLADDAFVHGLKQIFHAEGIDVSLAKTFPGSQTGLYIVGNKAGQTSDDAAKDYLYYRQGSAASLLSPKDIDGAAIQNAKIVYATGITIALSESTSQAVHKAFRLAKEAGVMTVFDPNFRARLWKRPMDALEAINALLPYVDVILPTVPDDTSATIGLNRPEQVIDYFWFKEVPLVVVKAGQHGCYVGYKKKIEHIPALRAERIVDTVGAGDAFNAGFIHGLATHLGLSDCARLGVTTAGLMIQRRGVLDSLPIQESVYSRVQLNTSPASVV